MGKYINKNSKGEFIGSSFRSKIKSLLEEGAVEISTPTEWKEGLVVVVDNFAFGAAAYAYSEDEMNYFITGMNGRPFQWLYLENAKNLEE